MDCESERSRSNWNQRHADHLLPCAYVIDSQGNLDLVQSRLEGSDGLGDGSDPKETAAKPSQDVLASSEASAAQAEALEQPSA